MHSGQPWATWWLPREQVQSRYTAPPRPLVSQALTSNTNSHSILNSYCDAWLLSLGDFPGGSDGKESSCCAETWVRSLSWEGPLEKRMASPSRILAWRVPWTEEPGGYSLYGHKESDMIE